ncbi:hypothetical protein EVAR_56891_1 [Eumeta japonica]|uniref:Uncharacterized protein n=1 Tax=Eumeta variegata TaxID=151549 RepID=A0A4C1ZMW3_EUMVA|nr:hypothetical protein EVAR_56891_1 [Eumeta japonica]
MGFWTPDIVSLLPLLDYICRSVNVNIVNASLCHSSRSFARNNRLTACGGVDSPVKNLNFGSDDTGFDSRAKGSRLEVRGNILATDAVRGQCHQLQKKSPKASAIKTGKRTGAGVGRREAAPRPVPAITESTTNGLSAALLRAAHCCARAICTPLTNLLMAG